MELLIIAFTEVILGMWLYAILVAIDENAFVIKTIKSYYEKCNSVGKVILSIVLFLLVFIICGAFFAEFLGNFYHWIIYISTKKD